MRISDWSSDVCSSDLRLSYSLDWSALGGDRLRLLAGAEREWTRTLTANAFSSDAGRTAITSFWGMPVGRPTDSLSIPAGGRHDDHRDFCGAHTFAVAAGQTLGHLVRLRARYPEVRSAPTP